MKYSPCKNGQHDLEVISRVGPELEEIVTRWCRNCGAIVIDLDSDARTYPGRIMTMQFPNITKNNCIKDL